MSIDRDKLQQLNAQINLKLSEGKLDEAERLSVSLMENAMGLDTRQNGPKELLSGMISKIMSTVSSVTTPAPTIEQIEAIKETAVNDEHLRLLSIFHYVNAALSALFSCFFLIHISMGILMVANPKAFTQPPTPGFGWFFIFGGMIPLLIGFTYAALNIFAGRCLKKRVRRNLCLGVASLNCMNIPFGTTLGILTLLVLCREKIKSTFRSTRTTTS